MSHWVQWRRVNGWVTGWRERACSGSQHKADLLQIPKQAAIQLPVFVVLIYSRLTDSVSRDGKFRRRVLLAQYPVGAAHFAAVGVAAAQVAGTAAGFEFSPAVGNAMVIKHDTFTGVKAEAQSGT